MFHGIWIFHFIICFCLKYLKFRKDQKIYINQLQYVKLHWQIQFCLFFVPRKKYCFSKFFLLIFTQNIKWSPKRNTLKKSSHTFLYILFVKAKVRWGTFRIIKYRQYRFGLGLYDLLRRPEIKVYFIEI